MNNEPKEAVQDAFGVWAIVELFGHTKAAGFLSEQELFGNKMARLDIPAGEGEPSLTKYYNGSAIYGFTPVSEEIAKAFAIRNRPRPVHAYELALPNPRVSQIWEHGDSEEDDW